MDTQKLHLALQHLAKRSLRAPVALEDAQSAAVSHDEAVNAIAAALRELDKLRTPATSSATDKF